MSHHYPLSRMRLGIKLKELDWLWKEEGRKPGRHHFRTSRLLAQHYRFDCRAAAGNMMVPVNT